MTPNLRKKIELYLKNQKPSDLHFRKECGGYGCGAHISWTEGFQASLNLLEPLIEACSAFYETDHEFAEAVLKALAELEKKLEQK